MFNLTVCWQGSPPHGKLWTFWGSKVRKGLLFYTIPPSRLQGGEPQQGSLLRSTSMSVCFCVCACCSVFMNIHLMRSCFRCHGKFLCSSHSAGSEVIFGVVALKTRPVPWLFRSPPAIPVWNKDLLCFCATDMGMIYFGQEAWVSPTITDKDRNPGSGTHLHFKNVAFSAWLPI